MKQRFHIKRENQIHRILEWLEELPKEQKSGLLIHHIQNFQIVSIPFHSAGAGYAAVVLCQCMDHSSDQDEVVIEQLLDQSDLLKKLLIT